MDLSEQPSSGAAPFLTRTDDCQGRGVGARVELHGDDPGPPTPQPELFSLEEEPGGARPDRLSAVSGPQGRAQRRTLQQIVDPVPLLPTLDDPAPQMMEQLPDSLQFLRALSLDPEQAIEVPKILPVDVPLRTSVREPQLVEQLVEVPTLISYSSLQRSVEQIIDNPVPRPGGAGGLQGLQAVQGSAASSSDSPGEAGEGFFFALFPT